MNKYVPRTKRVSQLPEWAKRDLLNSLDQVADTEAIQTAARIMREYGGKGALRRLLSDFASGELGHVTAKKFGISKQRVSQWKKILGYTTESYNVRPIVAEALKSDTFFTSRRPGQHASTVAPKQ